MVPVSENTTDTFRDQHDGGECDLEPHRALPVEARPGSAEDVPRGDSPGCDR